MTRYVRLMCCAIVLSVAFAPSAAYGGTKVSDEGMCQPAGPYCEMQGPAGWCEVTCNEPAWACCTYGATPRCVCL